jgi:protein-serine/threonine kinase
MKPSRAATGLSSRGNSKIVFGTTPKPERPSPTKRSNSVTDVNKGRKNQPDISIPAQAGSGLKARRLSTSLPDDFFVDTCELNDEFTSASKLPGRKKHIGTGATATVKIMNKKGDSSGCQYAVKEFRKRSTKEDEREYEKKVKSEFTIAQSLHHKNIVETVRLCTHSGRWNHVMEYCQQGDVFVLMEQRYLKHEDHLCFFKQLLQGVAYLHEHGIAHRDIKLENLLMNNEGYIKITDFGVSEVFCGLHPGMRESGNQCGKAMKECRRCSPGICGSLPYIAPEVLAKNGDYDPRPLDVWSCAIVFLTMWHGGTPWPAAERKHPFYEKFASGWDKFFAEHPDGLVTDDAHPKVGPIISTLPSPGMKRLLLQMLHLDPEKRISIQQAINDRWVKTIDCCCLDEERVKNKVGAIDAAGKKGCLMAKKMVVKKCHNHLPPEKKRLPQHRFDMGHGYSRYD